MKINFIALFFLFSLLSCTFQGTEEINGELFYITKTETPDSLIYISYYENGKKKNFLSFKSGQEHGPFRHYSEDCYLKYEATHYKGELRGKTCVYDSEGGVTLMKYFLKDSMFYAKSFDTGIEQINPIITLTKDSIFVGDTISFQYRVPFFNEISVDKELYLFFRLESEKMEGTLFYPNDSLHITSKESKQIGIVIDKAGEQMIYGFLGNRSEKESINYDEYRKYITVYPR